MGKPNSLPTFSANLLTWKAARWLPRSPSTKVRAAPPPQGASLFELQFAPPPWATEAPFHSQHRPCTTLSKCPASFVYCTATLAFVRSSFCRTAYGCCLPSPLHRERFFADRKAAPLRRKSHAPTQRSYCTVTTQDISFVWLLFPQNAQWIIAPDALRPVPCVCCLSPSTTRYRPSETCGKQGRDAQS